MFVLDPCLYPLTLFVLDPCLYSLFVGFTSLMRPHRVAIAGGRHLVFAFDLQRRRCLGHLPPLPEGSLPLTALTISTDGQLAAVASADNRVALYRLPSLQVHRWTQALEQGGGALQHVVGHASGLCMSPQVRVVDDGIVYMVCACDVMRAWHVMCAWDVKAVSASKFDVVALRFVYIGCSLLLLVQKIVIRHNNINQSARCATQGKGAFLWSHSSICFLDFDQSPRPATPHPPRKRRRQGAPAPQEGPVRVLQCVHPVLYCGQVGPSEALLLESPWEGVLRTLPTPPMLRKRFGV